MKYWHWIENFISDLMSRASSRKFMILIFAIVLHLQNPQGFTGDNLQYVFIAFIGGNVLEKFADKFTK